MAAISKSFLAGRVLSPRDRDIRQDNVAAVELMVQQLALMNTELKKRADTEPP